MKEYNGLNDTGLAHLKDQIFSYCKNPEDHDLGAWHNCVEQCGDDVAYVEIRSHYTKSGNPVLVQFFEDEWL